MQFVINTPSGNIGQSLSHLLLDAGVGVTIISRNPGKVSALTAKGARLVQGSLEDEAVLKEALAGADGLFWVNPPNMTPHFVADSLALAQKAARIAREAGVNRVVVVSSMGAHSGAGLGPVSALLPVEGAFRAELANVVALRAAFFFENLLRDLGTIQSLGMFFAPAPGDVAFPMVATRDIASRAASYLLSGWTGHVITGVHGPRNQSQNEVAALISEALGKPVTFVQVSLEQARGGMIQAGLPDFIADLYLEMYQAMLQGRMNAAEPRTPETTTITSFKTWLQEVLVPAYRASLPLQAH